MVFSSQCTVDQVKVSVTVVILMILMYFLM